MRLLVDARSLGSNPGGIGMYTYDFLLELVKDSRVELILISDVAQSEEMLHLADLGVTIHTYGKLIRQSYHVFRYFAFVQDLLDYFHPDVFWEPNGVIPIKLRRFEGKIMITIHDMFPLMQPELHGRIYPKYYRYSMKKAVSQASLITYNSAETKADTKRFFPQVESIPSLVSHIIIPKPETYESTQDPDMLFHDITVDGEDYFLYVGNMELRKGTDLLLKAYDLYRDMGGTKKLYLGGLIRDDEVQKVYDEISAKRPELVYVGYVEEEQKAALFYHCAGFLFPSRAEGFGIPVIEAMHYNKPILTSDLSIFKEVAGGAVHTFSLEGDEQAQILHLAQAMKELHSADFAAYDAVKRSYLPENLGQKFVDFLFQHA